MSVIRKVDDDSLAEAAEIIRRGGLVVVPTDTVYGVACNPFSTAAIDRIYEIKGRPRFKALQVLLSSIEELDALGLDLPVPLNRLTAAFCRARSPRLRWPARIARWVRCSRPHRGRARRASASRIPR